MNDDRAPENSAATLSCHYCVELTEIDRFNLTVSYTLVYLSLYAHLNAKPRKDAKQIQ